MSGLGSLFGHVLKVLVFLLVLGLSVFSSLFDLLLLFVSDLLFGIISELASEIGLWVLSSLDLLEVHTDDGFLNSSSSLGLSLLSLIDLVLLVESSPCGSPSKFDSLSLVVIE